jgi:hypothetical protein
MAAVRRVILVLAAAAFLAGCVSSTAVPLRTDVWRLQVAVDRSEDARRVKARILREAAGVAFDAGYPFFLIEPATARDPDAELGRSILYGRTRGFLPGATAPGADATAAVRVVLLERGDARAPGAYDTLKVLNP